MSAGDNDLNYKIKIEGDLAGAPKAEKAMKQVTAAAKEMGKQAREAGKQVEASAQKQKGLFGRMSDAWRSKGGGLAGAGAAVGSVLGVGAVAGPVAGTAAAAAAIGIVTKAINEHGNAQERQARLDAALAAQGHLREDYRAQLRGLASDLQKVTGIADDEWTEVIRKLTQFGAGPDRIEQSVEATKNLAGVLDGDLATAAQMVGKALEGEFTAFSRLGIVFNDHMSDAEKLTKLYEVLRLRGAGQLEAANEGLNGSFRTLRNGTSDLFEGLGAMLSRVLPLKQAARDLGNAFSSVGGAMAGIEGASGKLKNGAGVAGKAMDDAASRTRKYTEELDKLKQKANESKDALNEFLKLKDEEKDTKIAEAEAIRDRNLKIIDEQEKRGLLKPLQAEQQRQFQKESFEKFKLNVTNAADQEKAKQLRIEAQQNQKPIDDARKAKADAERELTEMKAAVREQGVIRLRHAGEIDAAKNALAGTDPYDERDVGMAHELAKENLKAVEKKLEDALAANAFGKIVTPKMIADQETLIKEKENQIEQKRREFGPSVAQGFSESARLDRAVQSRNRIEGFNLTGREIDRTAALGEAASQQRGNVERLEGGGLRGGTQAVALQQMMDADRRRLDQIRGGSGGQQRVDALIQYAQQQIAGNDRVIELLSKQQNLSGLMFARLQRVEAENARLESWMRHAAGR